MKGYGRSEGTGERERAEGGNWGGMIGSRAGGNGKGEGKGTGYHTLLVGAGLQEGMTTNILESRSLQYMHIC